jgi:phenylalanyl-tRNA synthetase beta chain
VIIGNQVIGYLGEIHPLVQEKYDLENRTYLFEVNLNSIIEAASVNIKYAPVAKYPAVERDMALLAKDSVPAGAINDVICASGGDILSDVNLFDVYKGTQIPEGYKSLAYSLLFQAKDRTLVDEEVSQAFERITKSLFERLEVELR